MWALIFLNLRNSSFFLFVVRRLYAHSEDGKIGGLTNLLLVRPYEKCFISVDDLFQLEISHLHIGTSSTDVTPLCHELVTTISTYANAFLNVDIAVSMYEIDSSFVGLCIFNLLISRYTASILLSCCSAKRCKIPNIWGTIFRLTSL